METKKKQKKLVVAMVLVVGEWEWGGSFGLGRSPYVSVTQPGGKKVLRCFFSTPLGLDKKINKKMSP